MTRLFMIIYTLAATTLAGSAMVAVLVIGLDTLTPILAALGLGALAAIPVAWLITRRLI